MDNVLEYLETAYTGARAINDEESMVRIARAIEAYNLDVEKIVLFQYKQRNKPNTPSLCVPCWVLGVNPHLSTIGRGMGQKCPVPNNRG